MLTGMAWSQVGRWVRWWRLMGGRKYWLGLPSPLCCVTARPGAASSISPGCTSGRLLSVSPDMRFSLAASVGSASSARGATTVMAGNAVEAPVPGPKGSAVCARASLAAASRARPRNDFVCIRYKLCIHEVEGASGGVLNAEDHLVGRRRSRVGARPPQEAPPLCPPFRRAARHTSRPHRVPPTLRGGQQHLPSHPL